MEKAKDEDCLAVSAMEILITTAGLSQGLVTLYRAGRSRAVKRIPEAQARHAPLHKLVLRGESP